MKSEYLRRAFMKYGTEEQYSWVPELEMLSIDWADCYMALRGGYNLDIYHDVPAEVLRKTKKRTALFQQTAPKRPAGSLPAYRMKPSLSRPAATWNQSRICILTASDGLFQSGQGLGPMG